MSTLNWLKSRFFQGGKALSLYRRGMAREKEHDHRGAIDDHTVTIDMPDVPSVTKAMALYHRALMHVAVGDYRKAVDDFGAVLAMDEAPAHVKRRARQKLAKRESRSRKANV